MALPVTSAIAPSIKLDRNNYTYWRIQVLSDVRAHGFEDFLFGKTTAPPQFVVLDESSSSPTSNPEYLLWIRRDQTLFSWLLASVSESMLGYINRHHFIRNLVGHPSAQCAAKRFGNPQSRGGGFGSRGRGSVVSLSHFLPLTTFCS
ncbi:hypothetical protein DH2020_038241 [Rehmannia glutinosa]|uniref:Retrotransposon Copia-like N-terminal domain-containing protein n=1 Tax=Rehmannia glutinosa TaxID=99300 RepID=A0ABR0V0B3_REHGL